MCDGFTSKPITRSRTLSGSTNRPASSAFAPSESNLPRTRANVYMEMNLGYFALLYRGVARTRTGALIGATIKAGMKRLTLIIACVAVLAGFGFAGFKLYRTLESMRGDIAMLRQQVVDATETAQRESSAASAASLRADQAALRAEIAAGGARKLRSRSSRPISIAPRR